MCELQARIRELEEQLRIQQVHHKDDLRQLRAKYVRVIRSEVEILADAVVALSRTPAKVEVASACVESARRRLEELLSV